MVKTWSSEVFTLHLTANFLLKRKDSNSLCVFSGRSVFILYVGNRVVLSILFISFVILVRQHSKFWSVQPVKLHWRDFLNFPFFFIFSNVYTHWRSLYCHPSLKHYLWQPDRTSLQRLPVPQCLSEFYRNATISSECDIIETILRIRRVALRHGLPDLSHVLVCNPSFKFKSHIFINLIQIYLTYFNIFLSYIYQLIERLTQTLIDNSSHDWFFIYRLNYKAISDLHMKTSNYSHFP